MSQNKTKPMASDAMSELIALVDLSANNPAIKSALQEHFESQKPVLEIIKQADGTPRFVLAPTLAYLAGDLWT